MESSPLSSSVDGASAVASAEATPEVVLPAPVGNEVAAAAPASAAAVSAEKTDPAEEEEKEEEEDTKYGFQRPEMGKDKLAGTVHMYERHVVLCYKSPSEWPAMVEGEDADRLPKILAAEIKKGQNAMTRKTRLTFCEGEDDTEFSNGDVLIFPDMIKYRNLTHFDVPNFVEEVLIHDTEWRTSKAQKLSGSFVFVCSHGSRDRRCGVCGPVLIKRFKEEIASRGLQGQVYVSASSHVGQHKYAGNVIIYSRNLNREVSGDWYGYVTPEDVPILLEEQIGKGKVVEHLWRGQIGLSEADQKAAQNRRLQLDGETDQVTYEFVEATNENGDASLESITATNENGHTSPESIEATKTAGTLKGIDPGTAGCCMGSNGTVCCQVLPKNECLGNIDTSVQGTPDIVQRENDESNKANITKGASKGVISPIASWFGGWQQEHTYTTIAVVTAVASVAIAYTCYRQLKSK